MSEAEFEMQKSRLLDKANQAKNRPYGYYEVLELSQKAKVKDIKRAYFQKARIYHPDAFPMTDTDGVYRAEIARLKFDEITEAYQTLMDIDQVWSLHTKFDGFFSCPCTIKNQSPTTSMLIFKSGKNFIFFVPTIA